MKAYDILKSKQSDVVYSVADDDSVRDAVALLNENNIGAVVVTARDTGGIAGILSERDIVRMLGTMKREEVLSMPVATCMTPDPVTCRPETVLDELMDIMSRRRIRHIPVMKGESIAGVISIGDVVKKKLDLSEQEAKQLKDYIALS